MDARELVAVVPLAVLTVAFGIWPRWVLDLMNPTVTYIAKMFPDLFKLVR
jgi:NADH:ubiquinone oxidoreductase subunit 4 (subunit M)